MSLFLGIDIGGTKIAGGLVTSEGRVLSSDRISTPMTGGADILGGIQQLANTLLSEASEPISGIGIGTGGQVDSERGFVVSASDLLPGWTGIAVKETLEAAFGLPCCVDNDVNAFAVGEYRFGAGQGLSAVVYLALGTGVGGALLLNGQLYHGSHWCGGEFGHLLLTTDENAPRKTLEQFASGPGLVRTYQEFTGELGQITGEAIAAAARIDLQGQAAQAVTRTGECLGFGLASLANTLDPELIVVGGGLAALGDLLLDPARRILQTYALPIQSQCPVVPAALGAEASVIGAACLAM